MRVSCQHCQADNEPSGLDPFPGGFGFQCTCGHVNIIAPVAATAVQDAPEEPVEDPRAACPKCGNRQEDTVACHRCGLVFANAEDGRFDGDGLEDHPHAGLLRERWSVLGGDLDDEAAHKAFIQLCAEYDALEFAGNCYRRLGGVEDPRITAYREKVMAAALARVGAIETRATEKLSGNLKGLLVLGIGALILLAFAIGYYLIARYGRYSLVER